MEGAQGPLHGICFGDERATSIESLTAIANKSSCITVETDFRVAGATLTVIPNALLAVHAISRQITE
jgi:hypothetical protein